MFPRFLPAITCLHENFRVYLQRLFTPMCVYGWKIPTTKIARSQEEKEQQSVATTTQLAAG